ncbi:nucleotidyl transferase AbiEii/AbiGii toxin family protein [Streptomyces sp. ME19-01-6]|uniref:nucleotidyl transferase AbiEii/AbiGii toxin family protein n=1 Tax=Streptomyces sp. ME19-01-6 TaxID=3028686 RepID=UPI0029AB4EA4|nr:nucleotidyl transferase AbiEii/AbiGii toxin family protein [Streptomyces sp. ME19-01-6]MDX3225989.1 nucleotidyl transferase AbiEii/AbiGii toxin family protein [Streptomyces sp. ME19-01-6]
MTEAEPASSASSSWTGFGYGPWPEDGTIPQQALDEATAQQMRLPKSLRPVLGEGVLQRPVFDPSMAHHHRAMRAGEPQFEDAETGRRWYAARRRATDLVLAAVADSPWADHLVLRGSVLLRAWYGEAAREPGDLDFVVVPDSWQLEDERTDRMIDGIARAADLASRRAGGPVRVDSRGAVSDEIWTYDRVPGRRLVIPWTPGEDGVPPGTVQLDFVFNEPLPAPAALTAIPRHPGPDGPGEATEPPIRLNAATPELSLAWKILWLITDMHPEGKDLYDAVLLAESTELSFELLRHVFQGVEGGYYERNPVLLEWLGSVEADWFEFQKDHPHIKGRHDAYLRRLLDALAPTYAALHDGSGESAEYLERAAWLAQWTRDCGKLLADSGMDALQEHLVDRYVHAKNAVVITRELLGRADCEIVDAAEAVHAFRSFSRKAYEIAQVLGDPVEASRQLTGER